MNEERGRQADWQELTKSECFELLAREHLGRLAIVDDRGPMIFPVNFVLDHHMVVFRTDEGTKLDTAIAGRRVAFEVDRADAAARTGWSVVVRGEAVEVTDSAVLARLRKLPLEAWAPGAKSHYVRILPAVLTGRRIRARSGSTGRAANRRPGRQPAHDSEAGP
jgi:nitroimidazol reductase NimA-like FMN-containing flavoprotein (pyridoxamine 5'-phosphate oxidase superfamily)